MKNWQVAMMAFTQGGKPFKAAPVMTRQVQRAVLRKAAFEKVSTQFGGEPRLRRRRIMLNSMHIAYKKHAEELREKRRLE